MMKKLLVLLLILLPLTASAVTTVPWQQTNLTDGFIFPALVNGNRQGIIVSASSSLKNFTFTFATGTSATTTNLGITGILSKLLKTTSTGGVVGATAGVDYENPLTFGTGVTRSVNAVTCDTASASIFGCLLSIDWTKFNNKISSSSLSATLPITYNSSTGVFGTSGGTFGTGDYTFPSNLIITGNSTTTKATTTNLFATTASTSALYLGTGSNVLKSINGLVSVASNGTDFTLISATTCGGTDKVSAISASGAVTCSADQSGGGGGSFPFAVATNYGQTVYATNTPTLWLQGGIFASSTSHLVDFDFTNATGSKATTTNLFSTTASTTNLFGTNINGFGLSTCTGTNALTWSGGLFSCTAQPQGTVTSVTGTYPVISSGGATPVISLAFGTTTNNIWGGENTFLSSTTLQNLTFLNATGTKATTTALAITGVTPNKLLSVNSNGSVVATSTIGNGQLQNSSITVNGTSISLGSSGTITAASSTLLANNNTWTGNNTFVKATTTSFAITGLSSTLLKVDANGSVIPAIADTDYLTPSTAGTTYLPLAGGTLTGSLTMSGGTQLIVPNGSSVTPFLVTNAGASLYDSGSGMMTIKSAGLALTDLSDASILTVDGTGNTTLPAGNLTLTAGNLVVTAGTITVSALSDGCLEVASGVITSTGSACGSGGGGYATIQDEGSGLTARTILNFTGSGVNCVDNAGNTRTDCTINAGAATAGGSDGQIQFNDSTALGGANGFVWNKSRETLGVGTTTPRWTMQLASSTKPQLALSDGSITSDIWTMRNKNGNLYFATSSPSTFATSTNPAFMIGTGDPGLSISSSTPWGMLALNVPASHSWSNLFVVGSSLGTEFVIDNQGDIGIGTTTPYGILSIAATDYTGSKPLFAISTSTGAFGDILTVYGTSTTLCSSIVGCESGARFSVGTTTLGKYGVLDQLYVDGRINSSWRNVTCDLFNSTSATVAQLAADTANVCPAGGLWFIEDGAAVYDPVAMTGVNGELYARLRTGTAGTATAAGDGAGITTVPIPFLSAGTSTPVMEVVARKAVINNASSSLSIIGFAQYSGVSADYATMPTNGCYFEASSTAANWWLVSAQGAANKTYTDTGVASSSVTTGTGKFYKFRVQVSTSECTGFIYRHGFDTIKKTNTTNLPTTIVLAPFVTTATVGTAGLSKELHVSSFRLWWRGTNDMLSNGL